MMFSLNCCCGLDSGGSLRREINLVRRVLEVTL